MCNGLNLYVIGTRFRDILYRHLNFEGDGASSPRKDRFCVDIENLLCTVMPDSLGRKCACKRSSTDLFKTYPFRRCNVLVPILYPGKMPREDWDFGIRMYAKRNKYLFRCKQEFVMYYKQGFACFWV